MKTSPALTQAELDDVECENPGCTDDHRDGIVLAGTCHGAALAVWYERRTGVLVLRCAVCSIVVARIEVAP